MGVCAFPKVEQVSNINVIHQEQYPGNVHLSTSHTFLKLLSPDWFLTACRAGILWLSLGQPFPA